MSEQPRQRVSVDAQAWQQINALLAELPYRVAAPIVAALQQTGGVVAIPLPAVPPAQEEKA